MASVVSTSNVPFYIMVSIVGILAHLAYFSKGEHHRHGAKYVQVALAGVVIISTTHHSATSSSWSRSTGVGLSVLACFLAGTYSSLLVYRLFLHPLNRFPGPLAARISDLPFSIRLARHHDLHRQTLDLHNTYGPFVRLGSSTLMIADPLAVSAIHGPGSRCHKGSMYDFEQPNLGIATRDDDVHAVRRRVWSRGFGERALRGYEDRIAGYVQMLLARLASTSSSGEPVDAARLVEHFAFDVLGDLALGRDFGMIRDGGNEAVEQLVEGMKIMALRLPMWLLRLMVDVAQPLVPTEESTGFLRFCHANLDRMMRDEKRFERPSLMAPLLAHHEKLAPLERDLSVLRNDCRFAIIAGSDTVAATLAFIFFYLARHPGHARRLRRELSLLRDASGHEKDGRLSHRDLMSAEHLNAIINETLRLHPPASTIMRVTPPEGLAVGNTLIPGDMTVFSSQYVIGRSEAVYERAAEFVPERWYSRPDMIKDRAGYAPFSTGTSRLIRLKIMNSGSLWLTNPFVLHVPGDHSCLGRPLALMEMCMLVSECVLRYDVSFAKGFDDVRFLETVEDCMSWHMGSLDLCFTDVENS